MIDLLLKHARLGSLVVLMSLSFANAEDSVGMPMGSGVTNGRGLYLRPICLKPGEKQGCAEMCFRQFVPTSQKVDHVKGIPFTLTGMDTEYWSAGDRQAFDRLEQGFTDQAEEKRRGRNPQRQCFGHKLSGAAWAQVFACKEIPSEWRDLMELALKQDENWILWENALVLKRKQYRKFAEYIGGDGAEFSFDLRRCGITR